MRNTYYFITCNKGYFCKNFDVENPNTAYSFKKRDAYILSSSKLKKLETILGCSFDEHLGKAFKLKKLSIIDTILYI